MAVSLRGRSPRFTAARRARSSRHNNKIKKQQLGRACAPAGARSSMRLVQIPPPKKLACVKSIEALDLTNTVPLSQSKRGHVRPGRMGADCAKGHFAPCSRSPLPPRGSSDLHPMEFPPASPCAFLDVRLRRRRFVAPTWRACRPLQGHLYSFRVSTCFNACRSA